VQAACKIVLEPIFEADFKPCSFGFRPRRVARDALQVLVDEAWRGRRWVVETDIANCFSAIPHEKLMQAVEERVCDQAARCPAPRRAVSFHRCWRTSICTGSIGSELFASSGCWCGMPTMLW
jgi:hypothetical protein